MKTSGFEISSKAMHWFHALFFILLLITGIYLFFTPKSLLGDPLIKIVHIYVSLPFILTPLIILLRSESARNVIKELMEWTDDDMEWFAGIMKKDKAVPAGKFNAAQKANFLLILLIIIGLSITGFVVWMKTLFNRNFVELNFAIHDSLTILSILLLSSHIIMAMHYRK